MARRAKSDGNYVSLGFWLFALIVMVIPLVNIVMTLVWAFAGPNESRKNFFKASIILFFVTVGIMAAFGLLPVAIGLLTRFKQ